MSHSDIGTWGELVVQMDLTRRGWAVYVALSPHANPDIVGITPDGRLRRFEARLISTTTHSDGRTAPKRQKRKKDRCDHWAFVNRSTLEVEYVPPLEETCPIRPLDTPTKQASPSLELPLSCPLSAEGALTGC